MNPQNIQDPDTAVKFLVVVWSGKSCVVPEALTNKVRAYSTPKNVKGVQVGIWGFWKTYSPTAIVPSSLILTNK